MHPHAIFLRILLHERKRGNRRWFALILFAIDHYKQLNRCSKVGAAAVAIEISTHSPENKPQMRDTTALALPYLFFYSILIKWRPER